MEVIGFNLTLVQAPQQTSLPTTPGQGDQMLTGILMSVINRPGVAGAVLQTALL